jgi:ABC-type lipoprotein export system ATPase subunit
MSILSLESVSKYYVNDKQIAAGIKDVSADFSIGEFIAVTGASGSGKSTLLNILAGTDDYNEGSMIIAGENTEYFDESDWERYRKEFIGFVYQDYNLLESADVYRNVEFAYDLNNHDKYKKEKRQNINAILKKVGLEAFSKQKVNTLSGGQKQRVAIARALAKNTPVILADEPTGNLDGGASREIVALLRSIAADKLIIAVTHNTEQFKPHITREIVLSDGKILSDVKRCEIISSKSGGNICEIQKKKAVSEIARLTKHGLKAEIKKNGFLAFAVTIVMLVVLLLASVFIQFTMKENEGLMYTPVFGTVDKERFIVLSKSGAALSTEELSDLKNDERFDRVVEDDIILDIMFEMEISHSYGRNVFTYYGNSVNAAKITQSSLTWGRMPAAYNEVIISSDIESKLESDSFTADNETMISSVDMPQKSKKIKIVGQIKDESKHFQTIYFTDEMAHDISNEFWDKYSDIRLKNTVNGRTVKDRFVILIDGDVESGKVYTTSRVSENIGITADGGLSSVDIQISNCYFEKTLQGISVVVTEAEQMLFGRHNIGRDDYLIVLNPDDYKLLIDDGAYQVSVYMKNSSDYKKIIASLEKNYLVYYPYAINLVDEDAQYILSMIAIFTVCFIIAVVLIVLSMFVLRRTFSEKARQNAILLSLGYALKTVRRANALTVAVMLTIPVIVGVLLTVFSRLIQRARDLEKIFFPLANLEFWFAAAICVIIAVVYLLFFIYKFGKANKVSINQAIKKGRAVL